MRYINFIGDGDSSVHTTLISGVRGWGHAITKQECANHAVKCYRSALENLVKDKPQYKGRHKLTEPQRKRLASAVRCAIIMRSKEVSENKVDKPKAAKALQEDILNSTLHCFGKVVNGQVWHQHIDQLKEIKDSPQEIPETSTDIDSQAFETIPTELPISSTTDTTTSQ